MKLNKIEDAIEEFKIFNEHNKNDQDGYFYLGICYIGIKNIKEALNNFEKVIEINPKNEQAKKYKLKCEGVLKKDEKEKKSEIKEEKKDEIIEEKENKINNK